MLHAASLGDMEFVSQIDNPHSDDLESLWGEKKEAV
jgi:hypothetical protein